eukprot:m.150472 g.150472  ORF g.150472 m.150472 type:complete len:64 (-) comp14229_c1_seq1:2528-2719(-)
MYAPCNLTARSHRENDYKKTRNSTQQQSANYFQMDLGSLLSHIHGIISCAGRRLVSQWLNRSY